MQKKELTGVVVSDKMDKTVVILVSAIKKHPKYHKQYKSGKKYHAHDPKNEYKVGDKVTIVNARPTSKLKRWLVKAKASKQ